MLQRPHDTAHEDVSEDSRRESRTDSCEGAPAGRISRLPFMHRRSRRSFLAGSLGLMAGLFCDHALTASGFGSQALAAEQEKADILADYAARLQYHMENNGDLRLPALSARDRRRAIPNDKRPPARRTPVTKLPPNPSALEGVVRRVHIESGEKVCALTFDMCELATTTTGFDADIVIWLQDNNIPATFFMGGKWMRTHERRVRQILRDPLFEIGNHAWAHGNFALLSPERMREEILDTQSQYELLREENIANAGRSGLGESLPPPEALRLFRFPYGRSSEHALQLLNNYGLEPIQWDVVAETGGNNASVSRARQVIDRIQPGSIILFHANLVPRGSFQLLRYVATGLQRKGYRFVTVGELLALGTPERVRDGYFEKPGDNAELDKRFGTEGTGR